MPEAFNRYNKSWSRVMLLLGCCLAGASCQTRHEDLQMHDPVTHTTPTASASTDTSVPQGGGAIRPYVNDQLNARLVSPLPDGMWEVRWQADLINGLRPRFVLHAGGRTLVQGRDLWQLFDLDGRSEAVGRLADSDVVLDPDRGLFYYAATNGMLTAYQLADGEQAFKLGLLFGSEFERIYFARRGSRIIVASIERPVDVHDPEPPEYALVEVHALGTSVRTDDLGHVESAQRLASLDRPTDVLYAALHGETLTFATPDKIELADLELTVLGSYEGSFTPLAMSLDESGRAYVIVQADPATERARYALWVVSAEGEKAVDVTLPSSSDGFYHPPVVGYDQNVYVAINDSIRAIGVLGEDLWTQHAGGPFGGMVVAPSHHVLVTGGGYLTAFEGATGERRTLFSLEDGRLSTPAILTESNRLLVASDHHLYCLEIEK